MFLSQLEKMSLPSNLTSNEVVQEWMHKGDNTLQMIVAMLVGLQCLPGLVILYGSPVKKKWAMNSAFMALDTFAAILFCWVLWGFRMPFEEKSVSFWGKLAAALDQNFSLQQALAAMFPTATIPFFQFLYATITLILITGVLLERMNFHAWMLFIPLWLTFSYTIGVYSIVSPTGWLAKAGIMDYSGGYVIHLSSGVAAFTLAYWVGARISKDRETLPRNNTIVMLAGIGLLWMGWTGFNSEDPYINNIQASLAVLNAHVCATTSILIWFALDIHFFRKSSVVGVLQGMITGLICITPVAGLAQGWEAIFIGMMSGSIQWFLQKKIWPVKQVDDTTAVFHTHAVSGILGVIFTGFFVEPGLNCLYFTTPQQNAGLSYVLDRDWRATALYPMGAQIGCILFVIVLNIITTSLICLIISLVVPLRLNEDDMKIENNGMQGMETSGMWGEGKKIEASKLNSVYDLEGFPAE